MVVLVTGGTGFVGRQVVYALQAAGVQVRLVIRHRESLPLLDRGGVESWLLTDDLFAETEDWWHNALQGVSMVIHLAWYAEPGRYLDSPLNFHCLQGTLRMASAAVNVGVSRFVGIGTCFEYDVSKGYLSTATPLLPATPYAASKAATYISLSSWLSLAGVRFLWCRLFYLYGEGEDERRLVPYLRTCLSQGKPVDLTKGDQVRDYLDVSLAGKMIVDEALGERIGAVNICSGNAVTIREFAECIADEYGARHLLRFGARPENVFDPPCVVGLR